MLRICCRRCRTTSTDKMWRTLSVAGGVCRPAFCSSCSQKRRSRSQAASSVASSVAKHTRTQPADALAERGAVHDRDALRCVQRAHELAHRKGRWPLTSISMNMPGFGAIAARSARDAADARGEARGARGADKRACAPRLSRRNLQRGDRRLLDESGQPEQHAHGEMLGVHCRARAVRPASRRASRSWHGTSTDSRASPPTRVAAPPGSARVPRAPVPHTPRQQSATGHGAAPAQRSRRARPSFSTTPEGLFGARPEYGPTCAGKLSEASTGEVRAPAGGSGRCADQPGTGHLDGGRISRVERFDDRRTSSPGPARHSEATNSAFCAPARYTTLSSNRLSDHCGPRARGRSRRAPRLAGGRA